MKKVDVLIIGGGAVGLCCAWYLRQVGREVTVPEAGSLSEGASAGNAGMIVPSHIVSLSAPGVIVQGLRWLLNPSSPFYIKPRLDLDLLRWLWHSLWCLKASIFTTGHMSLTLNTSPQWMRSRLARAMA